MLLANRNRAVGGPDNVRFDVTADASVNLGDMLAVKSLIGGVIMCP